MKIPEERIDTILNNLEGKKIVVVGDIMLDEYLWGIVDRISPEAPVPVVDLQRESFRLGGAANVAWNLAKLNIDVRLVGLVGDDYSARLLKDKLTMEGIPTDYLVTDTNRPTTRKSRIVAHSQQVVRIDRENRIPVTGKAEKTLIKSFFNACKDAQGIIISDYYKGVVTKNIIREIVNYGNSRDLYIGVDPKERHFNLFKGVSLISPNEKEASNIVGRKLVTDDDVIEAGWAIIKDLKPQALLITRGEKGMSLFKADGGFSHFPTVAKNVYDVTGAGDTVIASFSAMKIAGASYVEAAIIANQAAGIVVERVGTAAVTPQELREALKK